jgi:hypothetical protein
VNYVLAWKNYRAKNVTAQVKKNAIIATVMIFAPIAITAVSKNAMPVRVSKFDHVPSANEPSSYQYELCGVPIKWDALPTIV